MALSRRRNGRCEFSTLSPAHRQAGTIETTPGAMLITDRAALEARVCECYDALRSVRDNRMTPSLEVRLTVSGGGRRLGG
jgi:hypothetical protein